MMKRTQQRISPDTTDAPASGLRGCRGRAPRSAGGERGPPTDMAGWTAAGSMGSQSASQQAMNSPTLSDQLHAEKRQSCTIPPGEWAYPLWHSTCHQPPDQPPTTHPHAHLALNHPPPGPKQPHSPARSSPPPCPQLAHPPAPRHASPAAAPPGRRSAPRCWLPPGPWWGCIAWPAA